MPSTTSSSPPRTFAETTARPRSASASTTGPAWPASEVRRAFAVLGAAIVVAAAAHSLHPRREDGVHRGGSRPQTLPSRIAPTDWPTYGFDAARSHAPPF